MHERVLQTFQRPRGKRWQTLSSDLFNVAHSSGCPSTLCPPCPEQLSETVKQKIWRASLSFNHGLAPISIYIDI